MSLTSGARFRRRKCGWWCGCKVEAQEEDRASKAEQPPEVQSMRYVCPSLFLASCSNLSFLAFYLRCQGSLSELSCYSWSSAALRTSSRSHRACACASMSRCTAIQLDTALMALFRSTRPPLTCKRCTNAGCTRRKRALRTLDPSTELHHEDSEVTHARPAYRLRPRESALPWLQALLSVNSPSTASLAPSSTGPGPAPTEGPLVDTSERSLVCALVLQP